MVSETNRKRLEVVAAVAFWLASVLNVLELIAEGSSAINLVITVYFLVMALFFTAMATGNRRQPQ